MARVLALALTLALTLALALTLIRCDRTVPPNGPNAWGRLALSASCTAASLHHGSDCSRADRALVRGLISMHLPSSPHISPHLPISPADRAMVRGLISPRLPTSPHISLYLPISPANRAMVLGLISLHLPTSPHISAHISPHLARCSASPS